VRPTLTTERLTLRPLVEADLPELVALNADPEVMAFIGAPMTPAEVAAELSAWVAGDGDFGLWAGLVDGVFSGVWFLSADPDDSRAGEAGWRLPRAAWGHGYAVEGGAALLRHGFDNLGPDRVWAETMAVNARSVRVMDRLGMTRVRTYVDAGDAPIPGWEQGEVVHEITRTAWLARR
jgi:RimJ/RimL family protein N-acetyltransferase